ncbi:helix-turn-helix domain-containing protein [Streptomyces sp. UH6]|uniref:helix-turn-helix domain-containing protein n=1 Tax=Streptomyces sp. UH6 TaxID=2748379 RepID=UPI0015D5119D|nr:helix-turn-helix domain-containing protein [Streptomyces sp. UH6]NYV74878.1 helix-turn-helix domain-containing protein [Streptomyces sp. UH6]
MGAMHLTGRARDATRGGGVVHEIHRHTTHFTVVGNHLAQHDDLSLAAIGLAVYVQSLPSGTPISIKTLVSRRCEGAVRIAAALRELEAHGYLRREKVRIAGGRIVTRTVYCNKPEAAARRDIGAAVRHVPEGARPYEVVREGVCGVEVTSSCATSFGTGSVVSQPVVEQQPEAAMEPVAAAVSPQPQPRRGRRKRKPLPPVPQPLLSRPELEERAVALLTGLRRYVSELRFTACEVEHLTPGVAAWLEREVTSGEIRRALFTGLPEGGPRWPAAFVAYRLRVDLPAPPLRPYAAAAAVPTPERHPLRNCEECDRGYRGPDPQRCRACADAGGGLVAAA